MDKSTDENVLLPSLGIGRGDRIKISELCEKGEKIIVNLQHPESNPWVDQAQSGGIAVQIILLSYSIAIVVLAVHKLYYFIKLSTFEMSITQVSLALCLIFGLGELFIFLFFSYFSLQRDLSFL